MERPIHRPQIQRARGIIPSLMRGEPLQHARIPESNAAIAYLFGQRDERRETGMETRPILDLDEISTYLTRVVTQYETSAPTVSAWADTLFINLGEDTGKVTVRELLTAQSLYEEGQWEQPNMAANRIYKLMDAMKQDTTGHAGF